MAHCGFDGYRFEEIVTVERDFKHVERDITTQFESISRNPTSTSLVERGYVVSDWLKYTIGFVLIRPMLMGLRHLLDSKQLHY